MIDELVFGMLFRVVTIFRNLHLSSRYVITMGLESVLSQQLLIGDDFGSIPWQKTHHYYN